MSDYRAGRKPWVFTELVHWSDGDNAGAADTDPVTTCGTGVPTIIKPIGSKYFRKDGAALNELWYIATDSIGGWQALDFTGGMGPTNIYNGTGSPLAIGELVYPSGWDATNGVPSVTRASNADLSTRAVWVVTEAIADTTVGLVDGTDLVGTLNTNAFTVGDKVYLLTAGTWGAAPAAPAILQEVGVVAVKSTTVGEVDFYPGLTALQGIEFSDVNLGTGTLMLGVAGVAAELDIGAVAQGLPLSDGAAGVTVGTMQAHGASTSTGTAPGTSDSGTASTTSSKIRLQQTTEPLAAAGTNYVAQYAGGAAIDDAGPFQQFVPARTTQIILGAGGAATVVYTLDGTDPRGTALQEIISTAGGGAGTYQGTKAFATITNIASNIDPVGTTDLQVGVGFGLGEACTNIDYVGVAGILEAPVSVDVATGTVIPTTAPNGAVLYTVIYRVVPIITDAGHDHAHTTTHTHDTTPPAHNIA